jgi:hypothetical protein
MNTILLQRWAFSLVRHGLTMGAGYLIAQGYLTQDPKQEDLIAGLATALVGIGWSFYEKRWKERSPA